MNRVYHSLLTVLVLFIFEETTGYNHDSRLEITLPQGKIKGSFDINKNQRIFLGIPFASVRYRFGAPGKAPSWNGTFQGDRDAVMCKQYHKIWKIVVGKEDCLVLNVFTPTVQTKKLFPVMVFIHGGGFHWGSNTELTYNPKYLVKEKVIVVTINYRIGAFGFLCLGLKEAPGNTGLRDQIAALKWIKNNIAYFGGNPNSVTLFGQSYGAASINYLIFSHAATGLFHRAILESGSFLTPTAFNYNPIQTASKVALRLGYNTTDPKELLKIFINNTADDIAEASYTKPSAKNPFAPYTFAPCAETAITCERPLIADQPRDLLKNNYPNISVIIGFNNKEGITWAKYYYPITLDKIKESLNNIVPRDLVFKNEIQKKSFIDDIEMFYFKNTTDNTVENNLIDYFTASTIRYPVTVLSEKFCTKPNVNVYNYYLTYDSTRNIRRLMTPLLTVSGADHSDELFYIFDPMIFNMKPLTLKDGAMIRNMVNLWTSFAKTGIPATFNVKWRPCQANLNFIELGEHIKPVILPNENQIEFWKEAYKKYGRK